MLQRYALLAVLVILNFAVSSTAKAILFQAPGSNSEEFQNYALEKNQLTYAKWVETKLAIPAEEPHPQVLEFSQRALQEKSSKQLATDWERVRLNIELNRLDREVLLLLAEKLHVTQELCRYLLLEPDLESLLEKPVPASLCSSLAVAVPASLLAQVDAHGLIVIDGKGFSKSQLPSRLVSGSYQWRIISDRYEDRRFIGSAKDLATQKVPPQPWVSGDCQNYRAPNFDFSLQLQSQIYFSNTCIQPGIPKEKTFGDWASDHKAVLWVVGVVATGIAAAQLKDKTLVITKP
ncbi:MAG: hypothetical protein JSU04_13925 [Bdellovibrionales bacterium]|nr:hypothetical protein [Bdellovibrionales bacterium]